MKKSTKRTAVASPASSVKSPVYTPVDTKKPKKAGPTEIITIASPPPPPSQRKASPPRIRRLSTPRKLRTPPGGTQWVPLQPSERLESNPFLVQYKQTFDLPIRTPAAHRKSKQTPPEGVNTAGNHLYPWPARQSHLQLPNKPLPRQKPTAETFSDTPLPVPALHTFWDLEKTVLHETCVTGTVLWSPTNANSPTYTYISQKMC